MVESGRLSLFIQKQHKPREADRQLRCASLAWPDERLSLHDDKGGREAAASRTWAACWRTEPAKARDVHVDVDQARTRRRFLKYVNTSGANGNARMLCTGFPFRCWPLRFSCASAAMATR